MGLHFTLTFPKVPNFQVGQKGKSVKYVRAYLEGGEEEDGRRSADQLSQRIRRRARGDRRERRRERKLILGARGTLKTQRFRLGFLLFILFLFPLLAVSRLCPIVLYAYDTGTAGKLPCPCFNRREGGSSNTNIT